MGGGNAVEVGRPEQAHLMPDPAINQFLLAAPAQPEKLEKDAWPLTVQVSKRLCAKDQMPIKEANRRITKAVEMGKRLYEKARNDHASFVKIIKGGAAALAIARREKNRAERDLKKAQAAAADKQENTILILERDHANEKVVSLVNQQKKNEKTIEKLEKKIEDLEKEILKQDTMTETVDAHRKKKEIDLEAYAARKKVDQRMQEKKEGNKKKKKTQRFKDAESATLHKHGGSFSGRLGSYLDDSNSSYCSSDSSVSNYCVS